MIKYEIKKIMSKTGSKIAIILLAALLVLVCLLTIDGGYVNERGETETGIAAARKLCEAQKEWAGILDEKKLARAIEKNVEIANSPEALSKDFKQNDIAYGRRQDIAEIRNLLNSSFATGFREYDYYRADSLTRADAPNFYANRTKLLREWLDCEEQFSQAKKHFLIKAYEDMPMPLYYDYMRGWTRLFEYSQTIVMVTALILGYIVSGIFSDEFRWKADSVFFSTRHGRHRAVMSKILAGAIIVTVIYFIMMALYTAFVLGYLGADGAACQIQADRGGWKSFYNITNFQEYILIVIAGYIGCMFMSFTTMAVSARTRSGVTAVTVPFVFIFLPSFIGGIKIFSQVLGLLPDRLLQISVALKYFDLYEIGGKVFGAVPILIPLYILLSALMMILCYREYRNKQIV